MGECDFSIMSILMALVQATVHKGKKNLISQHVNSSLRGIFHWFYLSLYLFVCLSMHPSIKGETKLTSFDSNQINTLALLALMRTNMDG